MCGEANGEHRIPSSVTKEQEQPGQSPRQRNAGISHAWRALRHKNFRLFFGGQSISLIGTWMTRLATSWLVYRLTGSALLLGLVGFAGQIPTFLLAPFAGVWLDRLDRRQVLAVDTGACCRSVPGSGWVDPRQSRDN